MSLNALSDAQDVSTDNHRQTEPEAPPYHRWPFEIQRDERQVSPEPDTKSLPWQRDWSKPDDYLELQPRKQREFRAQSDHFDHHQGRSTAATWFKIPDDDRSKFKILKSWNDGTRDSDRQSVECERDKYIWIDTLSQRFELPSIVTREAKRLIRDLGDLRKLGAYNGLYRSVLACLTRAYWRFGLRRRYDIDECWYDRDDIKRFMNGIDITELELREAAKLIGRKTDLPS